MKNITIFIILGLFLISMTTIQTLTSRSKQQVVLHSNDINALTNSINKYYSLGYRVTEIESQSIALSYGDYGFIANKRGFQKVGEILVIMEK